MCRSPFNVPVDISTHALREEGDVFQHPPASIRNISTHALREEGDPTISLSKVDGVVISTHALREEGDPSWVSCWMRRTLTFLPTPSARRATGR